MIPAEQDILIRDMARQFAQERLKPFAADWDREHRFPAEAIKEMADLGFLGMLVAEQWGGAQTGHLAYAMALEEIAAGDGACSTIMSVHNSVGCMPILKFGSQEQKQRFLQPLASGAMLGAFALTEPQAGSDASDLRTRARRDGDHYVLNGQKTWSTRATFADWLFGLFRSDPNSYRHHGLTYLLVPLDAPGITIRPIRALNGKQAFAEIFFDNVRVPVANRLGDEGQGWHVAMATAGFERGLLLRSPARYQRTAQKLVQLYRANQAQAGVAGVKFVVALFDDQSLHVFTCQVSFLDRYILINFYLNFNILIASLATFY